MGQHRRVRDDVHRQAIVLFKQLDRIRGVLVELVAEFRGEEVT